jgi:hypothetical protein
MDFEKETNDKTAEIFSSRCFWDRDRSKLNLEESKNYIITRVVDTGNIEDIKTLFDYYGWNTIKEEVVKIRYMNNKTFNWLSSLLEINPKDFRCYNNRGMF